MIDRIIATIFSISLPMLQNFEILFSYLCRPFQTHFWVLSFSLSFLQQVCMHVGRASNYLKPCTLRLAQTRAASLQCSMPMAFTRTMHWNMNDSTTTGIPAHLLPRSQSPKLNCAPIPTHRGLHASMHISLLSQPAPKHVIQVRIDKYPRPMGNYSLLQKPRLYLSNPIISQNIMLTEILKSHPYRKPCGSERFEKFQAICWEVFTHILWTLQLKLH